MTLRSVMLGNAWCKALETRTSLVSRPRVAGPWIELLTSLTSNPLLLSADWLHCQALSAMLVPQEHKQLAQDLTSLT